MSLFSQNIEYREILEKLKSEFQDRWYNTKPSPINDLSDFKAMAVIGCGSFGTVKVYRHKKAGKYYAIKVLMKSRILKTKQFQHILNEKRVLHSVRFPFLVNLKFSYKDNDCLYLGLPFINGGEMFTYLRKLRKFSEDQARFYASQVCLALEYLHFMDLVYRDLKPENIIFDHRGYLKLTDFGFSKLIESGRTWTLCGTPEYIAPEILKAKSYGKSADWWSFGVLLYEMCAGVSPFFCLNNDPIVLFAKIMDCNYKMPLSFSKELRHLVYNLLQTEVTLRYGNLKNGARDIKNHSWFKNTEWISILNRNVAAPFIPPITDLSDTSNFDKYPDLKVFKSSVMQYEKEFETF